MNYLDIGLLVVLGVAFITGLRKGFIAGIFSLAGIAIGILLAGRFYTSFSDSTAMQIISFIVILAVVALVVSLVGRIVSKIIHLALLGWLDAILGGVLGVIIAAMVVALILAAYLRFIGPGDLITKSTVARILIERLPLVMGLLPEKFQQAVLPYFR